MVANEFCISSLLCDIRDAMYSFFRAARETLYQGVQGKILASIALGFLHQIAVATVEQQILMFKKLFYF